VSIGPGVPTSQATIVSVVTTPFSARYGPTGARRERDYGVGWRAFVQRGVDRIAIRARPE
jgi:hypothetical protein